MEKNKVSINLKYIDNFMRNKYKNATTKNYFCDKKLTVDEIEGGIVLPVLKSNTSNVSQGLGGVVDKNFNYIEKSAQIAYNMKNRVYGKYTINQDEIAYIDEIVVYANFFYEHWGHYIIDIVSRLWYLLLNKKNKVKIVFTIRLNENIKIEGNYKEFLNLFGICDEDILIINKPTKFKKVIVPESSIYPGKYYTKEYINIFKHVSNSVIKSKETPKKIYLSRSNFKIAKEKEIGEKEIEDFFNRNGYVSISPESLNLSEQIRYFRDSEEIACISGTLPHNIVFANDNKNIIIVNKTYKLNKHQELINQAKNAYVTYIDAHISLFPIAYGKGPFILTINKNIKKFAKDRNYYCKNKSRIADIYKKIWYIRKYFKIYKFKIYNDKEINWKKLFKFYILK